jgi:hypothetical protein
MNTVSEILKNEYSDQGIQNLEIFYDTLILRLKIKDAEEYKASSKVYLANADLVRVKIDRRMQILDLLTRA